LIKTNPYIHFFYAIVNGV